VAHGVPVRLASHDDGYRGAHAVNSFRESNKLGSDYRIEPLLGKAWQRVRNGLTCLGADRQAFLEHDSGPNGRVNINSAVADFREKVRLEQKAGDRFDSKPDPAPGGS